MRKITIEHAEKLIKQTNGAFFGVTFVKADGTLRDMTCRLGVAKGLTGKGMAYDPKEHDLLTVWDTAKNAYRMIRLETLRRVSVDGEQFTVIQ
jgi:hypothetical protein